MKRIGIFGGSFDPVHAGHLLVAAAAREEAKLDRLIFMPARQSPFKSGQPLASDGLRLRMLRLALAGCEWASVSDLELRREGVSYTVDTLRILRRDLPDARWFFLIGEDHLARLPEWREADALGRLVEFLIIPRPGSPGDEPPAGFQWHWLTGWPLGVSSSQIRQRVREGRPVDHLVPPPVAEVIRYNRLYLA
ncbi:MAG: nicotinate-nucleotide adenylyltransferase [Verrucomicrobia bacterium]|nr:nicotinate-nucleotide adenylyltransferase [Verrucomicrobiota bacterium]